MEPILHFLGICPDSLTHSNLLNLLIGYYGEFQNLITLIRLRIGL